MMTLEDVCFLMTLSRWVDKREAVIWWEATWLYYQQFPNNNWLENYLDYLASLGVSPYC